MANRKKAGSKQKRKTTNEVQKPVKSSLRSKIVSPRFISILFLIGLAALLVNFLIEFQTIPPVVRGNVQPLPLLKTIQYPLYLIIVGCFSYFALRYLGIKRPISRMDLGVLILAFCCSATVYLISFNKDVLPNGDNAEYMILAKSLVERGGAYRLDNPRETPNSLASLGLPILLAPIYAIWGLDFVKMKILIMGLGLLIFPILFKLFRKHHSFNLSALLTIVCFISPYLVSSALPIMTETPYVFWSILALLLIIVYVEKEESSWKYLLLCLIAVLMTYLTRATGISLFVALIIYLFLQVPWFRYFQTRDWRALLQSQPFRRFVYLTAPITVFGILWQVYQAVTGISQVYIFLSREVPNYFHSNLNSAIWVLPQMLFEEEIYRWTNFIHGSGLKSINFLWIVLLLIMLFGMVTCLFKRQLLAIYTFLLLAIVLLGSSTAAEMVIVRYVTVVMPFLIYFFFIGTLRLFNVFLEIINALTYRPVGRLVGTLLLAQIMLTGFHGDRLNIEHTNVGRGPEYYDFIDVAKWCKNNLADDAYVLAVKPRLFYIFSDKKAGRLTSTGEVNTDEYILDKLQSFKDKGVTHIVLDRISGATRRNIFPLVEEHPDLFQTMYLGQIASTSAVLKLK